MEWWPALVFGWPGPILAFVLTAMGAAVRRRACFVGAAVALLPFTLYLAANPGTRGLIILPLVPLLGAVGADRGSPWLGWLSVAALGVAILWVATFVFRAFLL